MAAVTATSMQGSGARTVSVLTAGASDTITYQPGDILLIDNVTAGALTPLIDGDGATTWPAPGIGNVSVSGGLTLSSIAAGAMVTIPLDTIKAYLQGTITITGADGAKLSLLRS